MFGDRLAMQEEPHRWLFEDGYLKQRIRYSDPDKMPDY